jgi:hypothetical protein
MAIIEPRFLLGTAYLKSSVSTYCERYRISPRNAYGWFLYGNLTCAAGSASRLVLSASRGKAMAYFDPSMEMPERIGKVGGDIMAAFITIFVVFLVISNFLS